MDSELIRFRIDAELRRKAELVCSELGLGLELTDILRILITQMARDGALPFALGRRIPDAEAEPDRDDLEGPLWSSLKPQIDAELAIHLLVSFIADCSARLDDARDADPVDAALVDRLTRDRDEALDLHRRLDVADPAAVAEVIATYATSRRRS